jgi:hypothetical protein
MMPTKSPHAVPAAGGRESIGPWEDSDSGHFTPWRADLQTRTRGTRFQAYAGLLQPADAMALLLWIESA